MAGIDDAPDAAVEPESGATMASRPRRTAQPIPDPATPSTIALIDDASTLPMPIGPSWRRSDTKVTMSTNAKKKTEESGTIMRPKGGVSSRQKATCMTLPRMMATMKRFMRLSAEQTFCR